MTYLKRVLIALDQLFAVVLFGCMPDETISAMAYVAEMTGTQNSPEYRNG